MEETRDFEAQLRELGTQIERLDHELTQQDILLHSILKHYPDEEAHLPGYGRASMERSKSEIRERIQQWTKELAQLRVEAIGITAQLPVAGSTMRQLQLTGSSKASPD
ncbi:MAG: hypothetical protein ACXWCP_15820 [Burkholderiales bacterium]